MFAWGLGDLSSGDFRIGDLGTWGLDDDNDDGGHDDVMMVR